MKQVAKNLLTLGLTLTVAGFTMGACDNNIEKINRTNNEKEKIAALLAEDSQTDIFDIDAIKLNKNGDSCFVEFTGHYDEGSKPGWYGKTYQNHKDYIIIYKIDEQKYSEIAKFCSGYIKASSLPDGSFEVLQSVVDEYQVISVKEVEEEELCK